MAVHVERPGTRRKRSRRSRRRAGRCAVCLGDMADKATPQKVVDETVAEFWSCRYSDQQRRHDPPLTGCRFLGRGLAGRDRRESHECISLSQIAGRHMIEQRRRQDREYRVPAFVSGRDNRARVHSVEIRCCGLDQSLANEWAKHNVNVNAIAPGYMRRTTRLHYRLTRRETVRYSNVFPQAVGGSRRTWRVQRYFFRRQRAIICTVIS